MIQAQVLNYILSTKDTSFIYSNNLTEEYFSDYKDEFNFILFHIKKYSTIPDIETFINNFNDFDIFNVSESPKYLLDELLEDRNQRYLANSFNKVRKALLDNDIQSAINIYQHISDKMSITNAIVSTDLISDTTRFDYFLDIQNDWSKHYIPTGFVELDRIFGGWDRFNDFAIIVGRPGNGKSWVGLKCALAAAKAGLTVGFYSGEMSEIAVGQRLDVLISHINLIDIMRGKSTIDAKYKTHLEELPKLIKGKLKVITPKSIGRSATVSDLKSFIVKDKIDILFIDQISLMEDEKHGRTFIEQVANISKGLKQLQTTSCIPIIALSQANRNAVENKGVIGTENISLSDRLGQDASVVLAIQRDKENNIMTLSLVKSRNSEAGLQFNYAIDLSRGEFNYIPEGEQENDDAYKNRYGEEDVF